MYKRVIIKISGEGLAGGSDGHYHNETVHRIVDDIDAVIKSGVETAIVVGGGNFWRGRDASPEMDKSKAHQIGMLASVMNGLYLAEVFRLRGAGAVVMTPFDVGAFTQRFTKEAAARHMREGAALIFAGGTGLPFFSTDAIAAVRACELSADAVLYAKTVGSVYDCDPRKSPNARMYKTVSYETVLAERLGVADLSAIDLTHTSGIPSVVFALSKPGAIAAACRDDGALFAVGGTLAASGLTDEYY